MDPSPIPDQDDFARDVSAKMSQCFDELLAVDGTFKMPFVDLAGKRQGYCRGQRPPFPGHSTKKGSFSDASPGGSQRFLKGEAKFIPKHDFCADSLRLFLSWANLAATRLLPTLSPALQLAARVFAD